MHIKRKTISKFWPIAKTGTKYIARANHNSYSAMTVLMALRDILKITKNKKETKKLINEKKILVNGKIIKETNYPLSLFDYISFPSIKKYYKVSIKDRKYSFEEIKEKDAESRIYKIIGKKKLAKGKNQLNLNNGINILSEEKAETGNFAAFDILKKKILRIIKLEKGVNVMIINGKDAGKRGKIKEIFKEGENELAKISSDEGELRINIKNLFVTE